jgi:hypothetical protein
MFQAVLEVRRFIFDGGIGNIFMTIFTEKVDVY